MDIQVLPHSLGRAAVCHNLFEKVFATKDEALDFVKNINLYVRSDDSKVEEVIHYETTQYGNTDKNPFIKLLNKLIKNGYYPFYDKPLLLKEPNKYVIETEKDIVKIKYEDGIKYLSINDFFISESGMFEFLLEKKLFNKYRIYNTLPGYINLDSNEGLSLVFNYFITKDARKDVLMNCINTEKLD